MLNKIDALMIASKARVNKFLNEEKGDTNFISILIILGIVILLATVFIVFKNQIVESVTEIMDGFDIKSTSTTRD